LSPVLLAGLLYLGAAAALWGWRVVGPRTNEAGLRWRDVPVLSVVVLAGGVAGPVLMLLGLSRLSGLSGALLLNLEAPFTMLLALAVFGEHLGRRALAASGLILAGAASLRLGPLLNGEALDGEPLGALLVAAACACWALDNNLTQRLVLRDPFAIVRVKALGAGVANTAAGAIIDGGPMPAAGLLAAALGLGSLSYGLSVVLDAYALRWVGAAREAAYFATAPFIGALGAWALLGAPLTTGDLAAMALMAAGVWLLLREDHNHEHSHEEMEHEHLHEHDAHHQHEHGPDDPAGEPHAHRHRHAPLVHTHPHASDAHHRHRH
jgi:drug/metabolite transporter (DMT)-like permease